MTVTSRAFIKSVELAWNSIEMIYIVSLLACLARRCRLCINSRQSLLDRGINDSVDRILNESLESSTRQTQPASQPTIQTDRQADRKTEIDIGLACANVAENFHLRQRAAIRKIRKLSS